MTSPDQPVYKFIGKYPEAMAIDLEFASKKTGQRVYLGRKSWERGNVPYIAVHSPHEDLSKTWNVYSYEVSRWVVVNSKDSTFLKSVDFEGSSRSLVPTWTKDISQAYVITQAKANEYVVKLRGLDMFVVIYPFGARELSDVLGEE